jgi:hypothetical protein
MFEAYECHLQVMFTVTVNYARKFVAHRSKGFAIYFTMNNMSVTVVAEIACTSQ